MTQSGSSSKSALRIALLAVMTALVTVFTIIPKIYTPVVEGYISLCDVVICFAAYLFGPWVGAIAGGVGTALADLLSGFALWAPFSLLIHGLQALAIGLIARKKKDEMMPSLVRMILGGLVGIIIMVGGYYLAAALLYGFVPALTEIPFNLIQSSVGVVLGIVVSKAVARSYPPITTLME